MALVTESLDLSAIGASYTSGLGQPAFDPRMMTALLLKHLFVASATMNRDK